MQNKIDTILFDVGATLRVVVKDPPFAAAAEAELMRLVETTDSHDVFFEKLQKNWLAYRKYAKTSLLDVSEMELWMQWMLPDYPPNLIARSAGKLTRLWRDHDGHRVARPDAKDTLIELDRRGYKLGIIANTITESEIPDWMVEDDVAHYFKTVILSSKVRLRKPDPAIYLLAARAIGSEPAACAYIGDNAKRDVEGTFDAGYSMMVRIIDKSKPPREDPSTRYTPNHLIDNLSDLLDIFPPLAQQA